ncbi:pectinesterase QRT1 [Rutidosis leptorrhynchoides]|uniref:pectinesterase QRT1 n=1 Tax=Rutidosis leptorrhynchoides TaxID=125765 RepID=UPI003A9991E8
MDFSGFSILVAFFLLFCGDNQVKSLRKFITWDDIKIQQQDQNHKKITERFSFDNGNGNGNGNRSRLIVVDQNGNGDTLTVQAAVDMVSVNNSVRVKIFILPGIYREKVIIPASKPYISFIGDPDHASETVISWNDKASDKYKDGTELGTYRTASVAVESDYFCASWITIENTVVAVPGGYKMQAVALRIAGDKAVLYRVKILGTQDTLLDENGSHYLYQCYIQGSVDFIFGNSKSLYKECTLHSVADKYGAIAAHHRNSADEDTGFSFVNCSVTGSGGAVYLGRAWGNYSRAVYSYCDIDGIIDPLGWSDWNQPSRQRTSMFGEYDCRGKGADRKNRVLWSKSLDFVEAVPFLDTHFIHGEDWLRL